MKKIKLSKERKGIVVALLTLSVVLCSFAFLLKSPETTLATEIKLRTYETLNQNEPMTETDLQDVKHIKQWAMPIVEGTLKSQKRNLSDEEKQKVLDAVTATLQNTVDAGNIEINPDGSLTDLSKSYVSNAVANAIAYALPEIDLKSTVDGSTTQYTQILDMQKILNNLKNDNESLGDAVTSVNSLYKELSEDSESNLHAVDTSLKDRMDALYTELEAEIVYNKETGKKLTSDVTDIQDTINKLLETQRITSAQLKNALSDIQTIFSELDELQKKDSDFDKKVTTLSREIDNVNSALVETQKTIEKSISDKVTELTQQQTEIRTELTKSITETQKQLQNAIDSGITEINNKLYTNITNVKNDASSSDTKTADSISKLETELKAEISSTKSTLTTNLNDSVTNINSNLTSTKSDLQKQIDERYQDALSKLETAKSEITARQDADKKELLTKQKADREALEQQHQEDMDALEAKHDADKKELLDKQKADREALETKHQEDMDALEAKHNADKAALEKKQQEETDKLTAQQKKDREELEQQHNTDVAALTAKQQEETEKLTAQQKKDREELEQQQQADKAEINKRVDTEVSNLNSRIDTEVDNINKRMDTEVSDLNSRIDTEVDNITNRQDSDKQELTDKINSINSNLQGQITDNLNSLTETINKKCSALSDTIDANDKKTQADLKKLREDMTSSIAQVNNSLTTRINQEVTTLNSTITTLDAKLQSVNTQLSNAIASENQKRNEADSEIRADLKDKIQGVNDTILQLQQNYDLTLNDMLTQITNNGNDISSLSARLNAFISSADGHFKIDMVSGFTIKQSDWIISGSNASYSYTHKYMKDCSVVEVDYASQYDLSPIYSVDDSTGTLTITIPAEQVTSVTVADVMCYHLFQDDQAISTSKQSMESDLTVVDDSTEEADTSTIDNTADIDGHKENEDSKDTYSQLEMGD